MGIELVSDFDIMAFFAIGLSVSLAYLFQEYLIPRGLSGLQVAFPTGPKRYEVHTVTADKESSGYAKWTYRLCDGTNWSNIACSRMVILSIRFV